MKQKANAKAEGTQNLAKPKRAKAASSVPGLVLAAERGDLSDVQELIRDGADVNEAAPPTRHPYYGADALIVASRHGHREIVEVLLAHGAKITNRSAYGPAIQQAIDYGHAEVVRTLLKHGARELGYSLFNAVEQNNVAVLQAVFEAGIKFDPFRDRRTRASLLEQAIRRKRYEVVEFLLNSGIKLAGSELVECAVTGNVELTQKLIARGANPSLPNRKSRYPLSSACFWGNKELAEVLLAHGADLTATDIRGWSCLDWARYGKRPKMTSWLNSVARGRGVKIPKKRDLEVPGSTFRD